MARARAVGGKGAEVHSPLARTFFCDHGCDWVVRLVVANSAISSRCALVLWQKLGETPPKAPHTSSVWSTAQRLVGARRHQAEGKDFCHSFNRTIILLCHSLGVKYDYPVSPCDSFHWSHRLHPHSAIAMIPAFLAGIFIAHPMELHRQPELRSPLDLAPRQYRKGAYFHRVRRFRLILLLYSLVVPMPVNVELLPYWLPHPCWYSGLLGALTMSGCFRPQA